MLNIKHFLASSSKILAGIAFSVLLLSKLDLLQIIERVKRGKNPKNLLLHFWAAKYWINVSYFRKTTPCDGSDF